MKNYKRVLSMLLAAGMTVSLAACGSEQAAAPAAPEESAQEETAQKLAEEEAAGDDAAEEKDEAFLADNAYGGLVKLDDADDPITFKFFIRDPNQAPSKDNPIYQKITELTGVTIEWEFLVGDLEQKQGVMIAGEDYPDAIFAESAKFIDAGAFIPVEDLLPNYPHLSQVYSEKQSEKMTAPDGHKYILELYGAQENPSPIFYDTGVGFYIQKAVLEDAGYVIPHTLDEYFELIENYMEKYPEIDGVKTIGFEVLSDGWRDFCLRNPSQHLMGAGNDGDCFVDLDTMTASYYQISDTAHDYYLKLNEEYQKGVIEAETLTQSYDQYISRISTGAVLGFFDQQWNFSSGENVLKVDGKYERTYIAVPIANEGVRDSYLDAKTGIITGNNGIGITINCENPERLLKFFDYLLQREVQDFLLWGEEGTDWNYLEDGISRVQTQSRRDLMKDDAKKRDETGFTLWNYSPKRQGLYDDGTPCTPDDSADEYLAGLSEYDQNFLEAYGFKYPAEMLSEPEVRPNYYPVWSMTIEDGSAASVAENKMNDIIRRYYPQLILCDPAEYETLWNEMLGQFESNDLQPYLDEINRQIAVYMGE